MKTCHLKLGAVALTLCVLGMGCHYNGPRPNPWPKGNLLWPGFGEPGMGKLSVAVDGDVAHPGRYYLQPGASLESIMYSVGGAGRHGDMGIPPQTVNLIRTVNGQREKSAYQIRMMTKEERERVLLLDGDTLEYPEIVF